MDRKLHFHLVNIGHALNHFFILIFPTAVLFLSHAWNMSYEELLKVGSVGVFAYGAGALPSGWLADKFGRSKMMSVFFIGIGMASILCGFAQNINQLATGLAFIGVFASIYHPVGIPLVYATPGKTGKLLAVNGVAGNLGLALASMTTAYLATTIHWSVAFIAPGILSVFCGLIYARNFWTLNVAQVQKKPNSNLPMPTASEMAVIFGSIVLIATCGGLVFNSITTALPKVLTVEPLLENVDIKYIGIISTIIFSLASLTQLLIGELMEKIAAQTLLFTVVALQCVSLLVASQSESSLVYLGFSLFATFGQVPINDWLTGRFSSEKWRSRFFAMRYTLGLGVASVAYWLIAQSYSDGAGFNQLFRSLGVAMIPAILCSLIIIVAIKKLENKEPSVQHLLS